MGAGAVAEADTLKGIFGNDQSEFQRKTLLALLPDVTKGCRAGRPEPAEPIPGGGADPRGRRRSTACHLQHAQTRCAAGRSTADLQYTRGHAGDPAAPGGRSRLPTGSSLADITTRAERQTTAPTGFRLEDVDFRRRPRRHPQHCPSGARQSCPTHSLAPREAVFLLIMVRFWNY
jgi:hypothetical protein